MSVFKAHIFKAVNPAFASVTVGLVSAFLVFRNYQEGRGLYLIKRWDEDQRRQNKEMNLATKEELSVYDYLTENEAKMAKPSHHSNASSTEASEPAAELPQHFEEHIASLDRPVLIYDYVFAFEDLHNHHNHHSGVSVHEHALSDHIHVWAGH